MTNSFIMAIYTPRGLKIRLPVDLAFTYIARLYPRYSAFQVLKTTEGIELLPSLFAFFMGLWVFLNHLSPTYIAINVGFATLFAGLIRAYGLFHLIPFMTPFFTGLSYIKGFGLFTITIIIVGLLVVGWQGVLFYFIGRYIAGAINGIIDIYQMKRIFKKTGFPLTASERNFFNAYRLHASRIGVTVNLEIEDGEIESGKWKLPFTILQLKWPEVVARFNDN